MTTSETTLSRFGFSFKRGGAHNSRTMMLDELKTLLACVNHPDAKKSDYRQAIVDDNCLGKRSAETRVLSYNHLVDLYSLDPGVVLFRSLLYFWKRDVDGQALLALLCTYARDTIFRSSASFILNVPEGSTVTRVSLEELINAREPDRFSAATLKSTAQNINSTWTKSGHLSGRNVKVRSRALPTVGSVSYALFLGYLTGARGQGLFENEYIRLLDCTSERAIELAGEASGRGWIVFKRLGEVMELEFPKLICQTELEWLR